MAERNRAYYEKYPEDVKRVKDIVRKLKSAPTDLPSGGTLSILRLRQLGLLFGFHGWLKLLPVKPVLTEQCRVA